MYFATIVAFSMLVFTATLSNVVQDKMSVEEHAKPEVAESETYRMFAFAAAVRMKELPAPTTGVQVYRWQDLKDAGAIPDGMKQANLPPDWKVVRTPTDWVVCAELSG